MSRRLCKITFRLHVLQYYPNGIQTLQEHLTEAGFPFDLDSKYELNWTDFTNEIKGALSSDLWFISSRSSVDFYKKPKADSVVQFVQLSTDQPRFCITRGSA